MIFLMISEKRPGLVAFYQCRKTQAVRLRGLPVFGFFRRMIGRTAFVFGIRGEFHSKSRGWPYSIPVRQRLSLKFFAPDCPRTAAAIPPTQAVRVSERMLSSVWMRRSMPRSGAHRTISPFSRCRFQDDDGFQPEPAEPPEWVFSRAEFGFRRESASSGPGGKGPDFRFAAVFFENPADFGKKPTLDLQGPGPNPRTRAPNYG